MKIRYRVMAMVYTLVVSAGLPVASAARDYPAVLDWADKYNVSFPVSGRVDRVHVSTGERVSRGTPLIELDAAPFKISLQQSEAAVAAHEPVFAEAKREYDQAGSLYEQTVLSDVELQRAQHAFEHARAELAQARASLQLVRWRLEQARALAPWDAWVIRRNVEPGQVLVDEQRSTPLLVLAKDGVMTARATLPATTISALHTGQHVRVIIDNSNRDAEIIGLGMQYEASGDDSGYRLEARFATSQDDAFRAGQPAVIQLP
jgi:RND family efflux transporter MFP subunit